MLCISCGRPSRYNRAVQHAESGLLGTLCAECEGRLYGRPLAAVDCSGEGCALCPSPSVVALPEHRLFVDGREDLEFGGYFLSTDTPTVCVDHAPGPAAGTRTPATTDRVPVVVADGVADGDTGFGRASVVE